MKKINLLLALTFCLLFLGCSRGPVDELKVFIDEKDDVLLQMYKKVEANPTEAGMDEARKVFESRKASLIAKRDSPALQAANLAKYSNLLSVRAASEESNHKTFAAMGLLGNYNEAKDKKFQALRKDFKEATEESGTV